MNLKRSPFAIQDKNSRDLDNVKDYPTIADLMREQKVPQDYANTVHHRRDLDSLGSCLLYTSPSPRDITPSRMPSSA